MSKQEKFRIQGVGRRELEDVALSTGWSEVREVPGLLVMKPATKEMLDKVEENLTYEEIQIVAKEVFGDASRFDWVREEAGKQRIKLAKGVSCD